MSAKKLVVSTYLQYILIALGALLLFVFVRQIGDVLLTFFLAAILAYALNPLVRRLEAGRIPRVVVVIGVFMALVLAVLVALLVLILPAVGQVQTLIQDPTVLAEGAMGHLERVRELPYVGEQLAVVNQATLVQFVQNNAPSAGQILHGALGFVGAIFAVPIVAIIAAALHYLRETLLFEHWPNTPVSEVAPEKEKPAPVEASGEKPAGLEGAAGGKR